MKERKLTILLALLAALALVFAGACSDGSDADPGTETPSDDTTTTPGTTTPGTSTENEGTVYCTECTTETCTVTTGCTGSPGCSACATADPSCECDDCAAITVTASQVEALLKSIGNDKVANVSSGTDYWLFASGTMSEEAQEVVSDSGEYYYVFSVADSTNTATNQANAGNTLDAMKTVGSNGILTAEGNPCKIDFTSLSESDWAGSAPTTGTTGYLKVTVELADGYSDSYSVPSDLETVYIEFTATHNDGWTS